LPVGLPARPARVTSSLRALKLHADARHHAVAVVLAAAYVLVRVWQASGSAPLYTRDSVDYERIARLPLSGAFASEVKPWGLPLFYKLLPGDLAVTAPIAQLLLSIVAWLALAFAFARCFESRAVRGLAFVSILVFSSSAFVAQWDVVILSESLSLSLYALVLAAALELARRPRRGVVAALLLVALLWSATRDTNTYAFAPIALALLPSLRRRRWLALALACGTVLILAGSASSASNPRRWELVMIDLVDERVLASPDASRYFEAHGMPLPPDLRRRLFVARTPLSRFDRDPALRPFRRWMLRSGRRTYASYLLSHTDEAVGEPLSRSGLLLSPVGLDFYKPRGFREVLPGRVDRIIFPRSGRNVLVWLLLASGVAAALAVAGTSRRRWLLPLATAASALPLAILIWDSEPREVPRHELIPIVMSRLSLIALSLLILEGAAALVRSRGRCRTAV
jgi:hypothetical protein